jgi:hypothetical protein
VYYSTVRPPIKLNATVTSRLPNCYLGKLILLFLWSDTWLVSGKPYSAWRWVMQFQPEAGKWQLRSTLSVNALYRDRAKHSSAYDFMQTLLLFIKTTNSVWIRFVYPCFGGNKTPCIALLFFVFSARKPETLEADILSIKRQAWLSGHKTVGCSLEL